MVDTNTVKPAASKGFALPERITPDEAPDNYVRLEELCNGDDIVVRGTGQPFRMRFGLVTPVLFSHAADWVEKGPNAPVFQFVTSSEAVLRHARGAKLKPRVGRVEARDTEDGERSYYVLV